MNRVTGSWHRFCVIEAGRASAAQKTFEDRLIRQGHVRENSKNDCDYYVAFCPISTRVGTDVCEAQRLIPGDKPAILIVMHHTRLPDYIVQPSERLVEKPNVVLTVDCLFFDGNLVPSERNDQAWDSIRTFIWGNRLTFWQRLSKNRIIVFITITGQFFCECWTTSVQTLGLVDGRRCGRPTRLWALALGLFHLLFDRIIKQLKAAVTHICDKIKGRFLMRNIND